MRDKNIKKQHSAQALSDDSLENVAGGWSAHATDQGYVYSLSKKERKSLKKKGYVSTKDSNGYYQVTDSSGNVVSDRQIERLLGREDNWWK